MPCSQWFDRLLYVQALFQYAARHAPLRIEDLVASIQSNNMELESTDVEMQG
jgi:snurportin-1